MKIIAENLSKKFINNRLFSDLSFTFEPSSVTAITGNNGSGKSTLLKILSGYMAPSSGQIIYQQEDNTINPENFYRYISISAPYLELIEDFTLEEMCAFHLNLTNKENTATVDLLIKYIELEESRDKKLSLFSSGMMQKLKLGLAFMTEKPILLLDEPTSNLDAKNKEWYLSKVGKLRGNKTIIICSNQKEEYNFLNPKIIDIENYK